ncbi:MAG: LppP/LprE family lipoprotein [Solirubrobacteraceae bacterium]
MKINRTAWALAALAPGLAACGSSPPQTVTVTAGPPASTATTAPTTPAPVPQRTTTAPGSRSGGTQAPAQIRTSPGPAFTRTTGGTSAGGDLGAAETTLTRLGATPVSTSTYDPNETLRVLIATPRNASSEQAFFFDGTKYLGTDTKVSSGRIAVTAHGDTDVTLSYGIYRSGDRDCCPSGAPRTVRFELDGGHLVALDPIPDSSLRR